MGSAQFGPSLHHRESVSSHQFKSQKDENGERENRNHVNENKGQPMYVLFNLRFHESRIERMPGYVSIQITTLALILVSYAPPQNGCNQLPSQS